MEFCGTSIVRWAVDEVWVEIDGYPDYAVSNMGRIRHRKNGLLSPFMQTTGYTAVALGRGRARTKLVHHIVCSTFHGPRPKGMVVNHRDGDKTNASASNLEWVTRSDNCKHSYRVLGNKGTCLGRRRGDHPKSLAVISTDPVTGIDTYYESLSSAADVGFRVNMISACCKGKNATHLGLRWRYA